MTIDPRVPTEMPANLKAIRRAGIKHKVELRGFISPADVANDQHNRVILRLETR